MNKKLKGLYAITDSRLTSPESAVAMAAEAIRGGARIIQLREKERDDHDLLDTARRLCRLCREKGVFFIVNDRVELAQRVDAHGVHIGKDDVDLPAARKILPGKIIGVSCYDSLGLAVEMEKAGADYVAFGSFFPSPTKPEAVRAPLSILREARERLRIPVCAIGGIQPDNAPQIVSAGADMIAVISSLWNAKDIAMQAERLSRVFKGADAGGSF